MKNYKKYLKTLALSLALAVGLLWPMVLDAQNKAQNGGGLFSRGPQVKSYNDYGLHRGMMNGNAGGYLIHNQQFGSDVNGGFNIGTQQFGYEAPLGGGWLVLTMAGTAYAFKKRKNNKKNNHYEEN